MPDPNRPCLSLVGCILRTQLHHKESLGCSAVNQRPGWEGDPGVPGTCPVSQQSKTHDRSCQTCSFLAALIHPPAAEKGPVPPTPFPRGQVQELPGQAGNPLPLTWLLVLLKAAAASLPESQDWCKKP